jgi:hypothetical protein
MVCVRSSVRVNLELVDGLVGAAGYRHLGADDVDRAAARRLDGMGQPRRAPGDQLGWQRLRVVSAGHAGVEVDLGEAGRGIAAHQGLGLGHGCVGRVVPPRVWTEMIAAQNEALGRQATRGGELGHEGAEIGGAHSCVAALLVDLVAGRFDQERCAVPDGAVNTRLQHLRMSGADRVDSAPLT